MNMKWDLGVIFKKIICFTLMLINIFLLVKINISANVLSELLINYYESDIYNDYLDSSSNFQFNN